MNRPAYKSGDDLSLFTAAAEPTPISTQFWVQLLRYRPILLLGSLWLGLVCAAAVAYSRLMFAGDPPSTLTSSAPVVTENRSSRGQSRSAAGREPSLAVPNAPDPSDFTEPDEFVYAVPTDARNLGVSPWSMVTVVGLSALGCFLLQRRLMAPPRPRKTRPSESPTLAKKARPAPSKAAARPSQPRPEATTPKRLQPFSPERDQLVVARRAPLSPMPPTIGSRAGAPTAIAASQPPQPPQSGASPAQQNAPATPKVTVVSPQESVPLDWPEGSLAHSLDIRQRRSLSSFM